MSWRVVGIILRHYVKVSRGGFCFITALDQLWLCRIHRCKVVGLSLSRATKSRFHREKTEHIGDGDRDMSRHHLFTMNKMYSMNSARGVSTAQFSAPLSHRSFPVGWC